MERSSHLDRSTTQGWTKAWRRRPRARRRRVGGRLARSIAVEHLEGRLLLDAGAQFDHVLLSPKTSVPAAVISPLAGWSSPAGYQPHQICGAYGIGAIHSGSVVGNGTGQTIAIVNCYDDPALVSSTASNFLASDLHQFDVQFGLADPPSFRKLDEYGGTNYPGTDPTGPGNSWAVEESLDVEWAHAIAPGANIVLVETGPDVSDLLRGVSTAANLPGVSVVSMSWGCSPSLSEISENSTFTTPSGHQGVTFVAAAGDSGAPGGYPAFSPDVVSVGGTILSVSGNTYAGETAWSLEDGWGTGGGQSPFESEPSYQAAVQQSGWREMPDVAFDAGSGVAIYDSYDFGQATPWMSVGGTSLAAPCWAGLIAVANQLRASRSLPSLDGPTQTLPALYGLPAADFHDITTGNNGYPAGPGYDMCTGIGTPVANLLVPDLASFTASSDLVTAVATANQTSFGQSVTITATVIAPPGSGTPTGTISFRDGSTILGTCPLGVGGVASLTTSAPAVGEDTITAAYGGYGNFPAASALVADDVNPDATTTTVTASAGQSSFGQSLTLTATVTAAPFSPTPTGTVTFEVGGTVVGTALLVGGVARCTTAILPAGTDVVTAVYSGDGKDFIGGRSDTIGPAAIITKVAGNGSYSDSGDGGPATSAGLGSLAEIAVDAAGDLFIGDFYDNVVREVNHATGVITTVAGDGVRGFTGNGGPATSAELWLDSDSGLAVDAAGDLFIAEGYNQVVREVNHTTGVITTVAGDGIAGFSGDGRPATSAELDIPSGLALDATGDLFIADSCNGRIREVNHATGVITTVAGSAFWIDSGDGGPATSAVLNLPISIGLDGAGDLFILDFGDGSYTDVREVDHTTGVIHTIAGAPSMSPIPSGDGGPATEAYLGGAEAMTVDAAGNVYLGADGLFSPGGGSVREVDHATGVIRTVVGNAGFGTGGDGGPAGSAQMEIPCSLALDSHGDLFIADYWGPSVREVAHATLSVTVNPAAPTLSVSAPGGVYRGSAFAASASVAGVISGVDSTPAAELEGTAPTFTYYVGGTAGGIGSTTPPTAAGTYTVVASFPGSADYAAATSAPVTFTITRATPTVTPSDAGGAYDGSPFAATALVRGVVAGVDTTPRASLEGVAPTLTYYVGVGANGAGSTTPPTAAGTYTVVASFPGSADYAAATSATLTFTIAKVGPTISLSDIGGAYDGSPLAAAALVSGVVAGVEHDAPRVARGRRPDAHLLRREQHGRRGPGRAPRVGGHLHGRRLLRGQLRLYRGDEHLRHLHHHSGDADPLPERRGRRVRWLALRRHGPRLRRRGGGQRDPRADARGRRPRARLLRRCRRGRRRVDHAADGRRHLHGRRLLRRQRRLRRGDERHRDLHRQPGDAGGLPERRRRRL